MRNINGIYNRLGKLISVQRQQIRKIALDRDNYEGAKYPSLGVIAIGAIMISWATYYTRRNRLAIQEMIINRQPLAERKREPDLSKFETKIDTFQWPY